MNDDTMTETRWVAFGATGAVGTIHRSAEGYGVRMLDDDRERGKVFQGFGNPFDPRDSTQRPGPFKFAIASERKSSTWLPSASSISPGSQRGRSPAPPEPPGVPGGLTSSVAEEVKRGSALMA